MTEQIETTADMQHEAEMKSRAANEMVRLKNGTEELSRLVRITMLALGNLWDSDPMAMYELIMVCRDSSHKPFGNAGDKLKESGLMSPDGWVHASIRHIVLSATKGEGFDTQFVNPIEGK